MKTELELYDKYRHLSNIGFKRAVNKYYRAHDQSHLFPIWNKFNATERAIRQLQKFTREEGELHGLEYIYELNRSISEIVNNERNW